MRMYEGTQSEFVGLRSSIFFFLALQAVDALLIIILLARTPSNVAQYNFSTVSRAVQAGMWKLEDFSVSFIADLSRACEQIARLAVAGVLCHHNCILVRREEGPLFNEDNLREIQITCNVLGH